MSMAHQAPAGSPQAAPGSPRRMADPWRLGLSAAALLVVLLLPIPAGLPIAGHRMLAVLAFAVVAWMTDAIDYAVSGIVIAALMAVLLGFSPGPSGADTVLGTAAGLTLAFSGFSSTALVLVAAALFLAAAMTVTGLERRIALTILARVGGETRWP